MDFNLTNEGLDYGPALTLDDLTRSENWDGRGGRSKQRFFKKRGQAMDEANKELNAAGDPQLTVSPAAMASVTPGAQPAVTQPQGVVPPTGPMQNAVTGAPVSAMPVASNPPALPPGISPPNVTFSGGDATIDPSPATAALPKFIKPTPADVSNDAATSPRLTKLGSFLALLKAGAEGALAGRGASEEALIQSHGQRNGGVGTGFEAGIEQPIRREAQQLGLEHEQVENQAARARIAMLPWEIARQRAEVNVNNAHANYLDKHGNYLDQMADQKGKPTIQQQYSAAVADAISRNVDPSDDPEVQRLSDAITSVKPTSQAKPSELQTYLQQNPGKSVQDYWNDKAKSRNVGRTPARPTELQTWLTQNPGKKVEDFWGAKYGAQNASHIQTAVVHRSNAMRKLNEFTFDQQSGDYINRATGQALTQDQYAGNADAIEKQFDGEVTALGQNPQDVRSHVDANAVTTAPANPYRKLPTNPYKH